ncbi:hypothetical protein [Ensifer sp.]|uniref:hypothetical protein n=1 Tax=Ensifer sp. TaxID=1872086 RepID=UPI0028A11146|nr:hypothetical protein [Ensifer sp.]
MQHYSLLEYKVWTEVPPVNSRVLLPVLERCSRPWSAGDRWLGTSGGRVGCAMREALAPVRTGVVIAGVLSILRW